MYAACVGGNLDMVKLVIERGADPLARDDGGRTALFATLTARTNMIPILRYLIEEQKLDINAKNNEGQTLLLEVISDREKMTPEFTEFLLSHGANMYVVSNNKRNVYDLAMQICAPGVKEIFQKYSTMSKK